MILVTGASGFVGGALVNRLVVDLQPHRVIGVLHRTEVVLPQGVKSFRLGDLSATNDWGAALQGVHAVVHCAARVHVMQENAMDPLVAYRQVNVHGTLNLAEQAARAGVRRFVFVSSVKVNGEMTRMGHPFFADDEPHPMDAYGKSKLEAEQGLRAIAAQTGLEVVIVRPPLVYGPGVKANFAAMVRWVARGIPLPLAGTHNARSMVSLANLVDFLIVCLNHPAAAGQTFLVSDGEDVATSELLRRTAKAMGKQCSLFPVPTVVLEAGAALLGRRELAQRLLNSLQVNIEKNHQLLGWTPPVSLDDGLKYAVQEFRL